jgi:cell fate regulator YaaT (PSP1 superfamily)
MCCLRYEQEVYEEELKRMPPVDSKVKTPDGTGTVSEISPLTHLVKVKFTDKNETVTVRTYDAGDVRVLERSEKRDGGKKKDAGESAEQ